MSGQIEIYTAEHADTGQKVVMLKTTSDQDEATFYLPLMSEEAMLVAKDLMVAAFLLEKEETHEEPLEASDSSETSSQP